MSDHDKCECGERLCSRCGCCLTEHNVDPVDNCPGSPGNPKPPQHGPRSTASARARWNKKG